MIVALPGLFSYLFFFFFFFFFINDFRIFQKSEDGNLMFVIFQQEM